MRLAVHKACAASLRRFGHPGHFMATTLSTALAELAPECAPAYFRYGSTLLYQAQDSGDVFGGGVQEEEEEEAPEPPAAGEASSRRAHVQRRRVGCFIQEGPLPWIKQGEGLTAWSVGCRQSGEERAAVRQQPALLTRLSPLPHPCAPGNKENGGKGKAPAEPAGHDAQEEEEEGEECECAPRDCCTPAGSPALLPTAAAPPCSPPLLPCPAPHRGGPALLPTAAALPAPVHARQPALHHCHHLHLPNHTSPPPRRSQRGRHRPAAGLGELGDSQSDLAAASGGGKGGGRRQGVCAAAGGCGGRVAGVDSWPAV